MDALCAVDAKNSLLPEELCSSLDKPGLQGLQVRTKNPTITAGAFLLHEAQSQGVTRQGR